MIFTSAHDVWAGFGKIEQVRISSIAES